MLLYLYYKIKSGGNAIKTAIYKMINKQTIVHFNIGKGGTFGNPGHTKFCGVRNISELLSICDSGKQHSFLNPKNYYEICEYLQKKELTNLLDLFHSEQYELFTKKTGVHIEENWYFDCNANPLISESKANDGIGELNWDGNYDTDFCIYLSDCDQEQLQLIAKKDTDLIEDYFNIFTNLFVNWNLFNGDYEGFIIDFFNMPQTELNQYYINSNYHNNN